MQARPHPQHAAQLLQMVRHAMLLEEQGVTALTWQTPLGPMWGEVVDGKLRRTHWGELAGYVVPTLTKPQQYLHDMLNNYFNKNLEQPEWVYFFPQGTPYQLRVWEALCSLPWGRTASYGEVAEMIGSHPRAVGNAVGANLISILIPCHRVVGSTGKLTGFSAPGGLQTKEWLLRHEGVIV